jgi:ABC-type lipoprotein release transport system permease subunit
MGGGYLLLSFSISLVNGSYGHMIDMFTRDHTGHIQIHLDDFLHRPKLHKSMNAGGEIEKVLDQQSGVISYTTRIHSPALVYGNNKSNTVSLVGIDPERERTTSLLGEKVKQGQYLTSYPNEDGYYSAMIGFGIADALQLKPGDEIALISQGADGSIANDLYLVSALVGTNTSWEKNRVFIPLNAAQEFLAMPGKVHEYAILLTDSDVARSIASSIGNKLDNPELTVSPWQVVEESFYKSMQADIRGNYVSLGVIIFIVCIGVLNTVVMSVLERTREFGVLRAIGTNPWRITLLIMLETCTLALLSCLIAIVITIPLIAWFSMEGIVLDHSLDIGGIAYDRLLGEFSVEAFLYPLLVIVASALVISIPPGIRAARITPVAALGSH